MKIRMTRNGLRFRLQRNEIANLQASGMLRETMVIGPGSADTFAYALEVHPDGGIRLCHEPGLLRVLIPASWAEELAGSDRVAFDEEFESAPGSVVRVSVEKDFRCLVDRPGEDDSDAFPNPDGTNCAPKPAGN